MAGPVTTPRPSPLCDQLLFLYEWLEHEQPGWLAPEEVGRWCLDRKSSFISVDPTASDGIRAVQPTLQRPNDEAVLEAIRGVLQKYALQHLESLRSE